MTWPNIHSSEFQYGDDPEGYVGAELKVAGKNAGDAAGGSELAVRVFDVPTGNSLCPYHYEYAEEWLLMITGELELRTPKGTETIRDGDLVCFPAGPEGGHKVTNRGSANARFMMWSRRANPEVVVYADSDKIAVYTGTEKDHFRFFRSDANVDYYDGEI